MKKVFALIGAVMLVSFTMASSALALQGDCSACHTMHNSVEGLPIAKLGGSSDVSITPIANLLNADCLGCHAVNPLGDRIIQDAGLNDVPQVAYTDALPGSMGGGNFTPVLTDERKGHNVKDLIPLGATEPTNYGTYAVAPGQYRDSTHAPMYTSEGGVDFELFTCAGAGGCHGTRSQLLTGETNDNDTATTVDDTFVNYKKRTGMAAISGAHHVLADGLKDPVNPSETDSTVHDGATVAAGYRMIPFLKGLGNATDRWENVSASSHNEYYGQAGGVGTGCGACHIEGDDETLGGLGSRMTWDSILKVPNNSMSGFCTTCHGMFHASGGPGDDLADNGTSGAFLRHPSDYVLPNDAEYGTFTAYNINTKVARPDLSAIADSALVAPGADMVMCLSCHNAHGGGEDYMLTFDYSVQSAGGGAQADGCLACHTTKQ